MCWKCKSYKWFRSTFSRKILGLKRWTYNEKRMGELCTFAVLSKVFCNITIEGMLDGGVSESDSNLFANILLSSHSVFDQPFLLLCVYIAQRVLLPILIHFSNGPLDFLIIRVELFSFSLISYQILLYLNILGINISCKKKVGINFPQNQTRFWFTIMWIRNSYHSSIG